MTTGTGVGGVRRSTGGWLAGWLALEGGWVAVDSSRQPLITIVYADRDHLGLYCYSREWAVYYSLEEKSLWHSEAWVCGTLGGSTGEEYRSCDQMDVVGGYRAVSYGVH